MNDDPLLRDIARFREYGGFQISSASTELAKQVHASYILSIRLARAAYLMESWSADTANLTEVPPVASLFEVVFRKPVRAHERLGPMFSQSFGIGVYRVFSHPDKFGIIIAQIFKNDPTYTIPFAFGPFPSLFGGFIAAEFCASAVSFLRSVFRVSGESEITDTFFASFFCSAHGFYNALWQNVSDIMNRSATDRSLFEQIFELFENALILSLPFLSVFHIQAFTEYCCVSPTRSRLLFIESLLMKPFLRISDSSPLFTSGRNGTVFANFLDELVSHRLPFVDRLFDSIIMYKGSKSLNPSLRIAVWGRGVPILFNECDVGLLVSVLSVSKDKFVDPFRSEFASLAQIPIMQEIFPKLNFEAESRINFDLFGVRPPDIQDPISDDSGRLSRQWRNLEFLSNQVGEPLIDFVFGHLDRFDPEARRFCACQILKLYKQNFEAVSDGILMFEHLSQLNTYLLVIAQHNTSLYHCFSTGFFTRIAHEKLRIVDAVAPIYRGIDAPPGVFFEIACIALDCMPFRHSVLIPAKQERLSTLLHNWMETVWPTIKNTVRFGLRIKYVLDAATLFHDLERYRLGRVLKMILEFQRNLLRISGGDYTTDWAALFHYAVFMTQRPELLKVFLYFHHYIFSCGAIVGNWGSEIHDVWEKFATGMWFVLKGDPPFCSLCSDLKKCQKYIGRDPNQVRKKSK
jgi:hypothetical protein